MKVKTLKLIFLSTAISILSMPLYAGEGMWLPLLLKMLNEAEMQDMGMKMTAEDIYSVNQGSLKDAIVHFGGFCTGEVISSNGLLLTNHHCGYSQIQNHSTLENNYLKNGFWAESHADEKPNPGLFARFIERIEDVSEAALQGVKEEMSNAERQSTIDKNLEAIKKGYTLNEFEEVSIRPFYHGNQYFAFVMVTYPDVRLVGAPPESIGKFGSDTDNWVWPRHTGDFSLFRIYASPDNKPAEYAEDNVPFQPKHFLPISMDGVEEGDFTLVFGFPGRTNQYLPSYAVEQVANVTDPTRIGVRDISLGILDKYIRADESVKLKYASRFASIANGWKKWIGESMGLKKTGAVARKQKLEKEFSMNCATKYKNILPEFEDLYTQIKPYTELREYYNEVAGRNVQLMSNANILRRLVSAYDNNGEKGFDEFKMRVKPYLTNFFTNYEPEIDQEVFAAVLTHYKKNVDQKYWPDGSKEDRFMKGVDSDEKYAGYLYHNSVLADEEKIMKIFDLPASDAVEAIKKDEAYILGERWNSIYQSEIDSPYQQYKSQIDSLQRIYMKALMETFPEKRFYPDANSTMRVTYGQVNGYQPKDAVSYTPVTYLDGVIEKYVPDDYEFDVDAKLLALYESKDYGPYADKNGKVPVCFIGSNHTSGGNSGSPAIDAHGNLIGLNFDRAWEGTMSDINYDASICRNIMVDARYVLFIIDKFAGASHLIDEMKLVYPKRKK